MAMAAGTKKSVEGPLAPSDPPLDYWKHILESLEEGIVVLDQEGLISFFNPSAEQLTGLSYSQVGHRPYTQVFCTNPWLVEVIERTLVSGHSRTAGEGELQHRSQRPIPVRLTCSPIFNGGPTSTGLILVLHDLSHQRELAEEVQQEDRFTDLGVVAAGLAHEIKNPLAGIRGAAQLLQGRLSGDRSAVEYTTVMIREIDRLSRLLEHLLQLSASSPLQPQRVNVHKILTDVLLLERATITNGAQIRTHFDPSLPEILGDEAQLAQVFRNLVKNSLQALAGQRGGILSITTRMATDFHILRSSFTKTFLMEGAGVPPTHKASQLSAPPPERKSNRSSARRGRFLSIDFADNGPGIPPDHLPHLFTPFFTTKSQGTGLGLAVSQRIIAQHGGRIRVESTPGQGTLFHVHLPVTPL
jgi:two-component system nitrogen regulation sensor histidine kinase GlnL